MLLAFAGAVLKMSCPSLARGCIACNSCGRCSVVSKIIGQQVVRALVAASIHFRCRGIDQLTVQIEGAQQASLIEAHVRLNLLQRVFGHEKRRLHRAVVTPKPNSAPCRIVAAALIWKTNCHQPRTFSKPPCRPRHSRSPLSLQAPGEHFLCGAILRRVPRASLSKSFPSTAAISLCRPGLPRSGYWQRD